MNQVFAARCSGETPSEIEKVRHDVGGVCGNGGRGVAKELSRERSWT